MAFGTLTVQPGQSPAHKADCQGLLFVSKNLNVGQPCGAVDGDMDPVVAHASRAALLPVARDAVANLAKEPCESGLAFLSRCESDRLASRVRSAGLGGAIRCCETNRSLSFCVKQALVCVCMSREGSIGW